VRAGQTHPHRPRLVVSHSTCPPLSSSPHAHSFVIGPAVIKHTQAKRSNDFWEDAVAWEAQRVEALKERKLRTQTAKRWAFAAEQEEEQQAIAEEAERRAAIHENATKAAKCLIDGFVWAREAQEEAADRAREKDKHWAWWLEEILKAGFDVYDFCDASFAPLDDETMELKFSSKEDGPRQRSHSPIVISSDDEADDKDMPQDQEPEDTTTQDMPQDQEPEDTTALDMPEGREEENTTAGMDMRSPAEDTSAGMDMRNSDEEGSDGVSRSYRGRKRTRTNFYKPPRVRRTRDRVLDLLSKTVVVEVT
jgi:hypothetical protein